MLCACHDGVRPNAAARCELCPRQLMRWGRHIQGPLINKLALRDVLPQD
eukprot:SAG11_NODE_672_length_7812_cov_6.956308_7_plen_49_part_00